MTIPILPPKKQFKPAKNHPWKNSGGLKEPSQREAENRAVPWHANPLKRSR